MVVSSIINNEGTISTTIAPSTARSLMTRNTAYTTSPALAASAQRRGLTLDTDLARNDEELASELYAIAAPVCDESGEVVAAVSLVASRSMIGLPEMSTALSPQLLTTAARISARLGYRRPDET